MIVNLFCDQELEGLGRSTVLDFHHEDGSISIGGTNESRLPKIVCMNISLHSLPNIYIIGGPDQVAEYKAIKSKTPPTNCNHFEYRQQQIVAFMWRCLFNVITPHAMKQIVAYTLEKGREEGRQQITKEFRKLLLL